MGFLFRAGRAVKGEPASRCYKVVRTLRRDPHHSFPGLSVSSLYLDAQIYATTAYQRTYCHRHLYVSDARELTGYPLESPAVGALLAAGFPGPRGSVGVLAAAP